LAHQEDPLILVAVIVQIVPDSSQPAPADSRIIV